MKVRVQIIDPLILVFSRKREKEQYSRTARRKQEKLAGQLRPLPQQPPITAHRIGKL